MTPWQWVDATNMVVMRTLDSGALESRSVNDPEVKAWIAAGNAPLPPPAIVISQTDVDIAAARGYVKLNTLKGMTPAQVQAWVDANVIDLASARDAIKTLAIAVGILARRL